MRSKGAFPFVVTCTPLLFTLCVLGLNSCS
uniref:Uncharacterized protein n=1 Tax=Nelumbo nucifera TaxID=4432 RepID=A0A822ZSV2_NELNU|nr:TPA_asm: hypothetical protein HUJ06_003168 [Nelumbo nucifera]